MHYCSSGILHHIERDVLADYQHQVLDHHRPDFGAIIFPHYGFACADHTSGGLALFRMGIALLAEESNLRGDAELFRRTMAAITFVRRWQRETGLIDLPHVDFDSPPDTAFLVQSLCPVLAKARQLGALGNLQAAEIDAGLSQMILAASRGMVGRGFRTPNHRWVVCSALAQAMSLFPQLEARDYVEQILAETIDINNDGEYSERSTGVYSAVCNRSLRFVAQHLGKPELLDHVRANLDFMTSLIDPLSGQVITSMSTRQDQGKAVVPLTMADSFYAMAVLDGNPQWLATAELLAIQGASQKDAGFAWPWLFEPFLRGAPTPVCSADHRAQKQQTSRFYAASKMWSFCRNEVFALVVADSENAFSLRAGDVSIAAVRVRGTYFHVARFSADKIEPIEEGVRLTHLGSARTQPGWDLPLNRPVRFDNPHRGYYALADHGTRERWLLPSMDIVMEVREVSGGFDLTLTTQGGCDRVPMVVEVFVPTGVHIESADLALCPTDGQTIRLLNHRAVCHSRQFAIEIGAGDDGHRMSDHTLSPAIPGCFRFVIAMLTPVTGRTIQIRYGRWSEAERRITSQVEPSRLNGDAAPVGATVATTA